MTKNYIAPSVDRDSFHCPHCGTFAKQDWEKVRTSLSSGHYIQKWRLGNCHRCSKYTIWIDGELIYPQTVSGPAPHDDMPEPVERDYIEAMKVVEDSPRSAGALLRLAIQRLMKEINADGETLHEQIGNLVEKGRISHRTQQALDAVRVIGNESVHPGTMDMDDDKETALALFRLINGIVQETIALDNIRDDIYSSIPENKRQGIENRDKN